ncbi:MAG: AsmA family protein, partial [Muribaculaceae bacterium]|nr:AsmA family protein [Muribaculaceae bacterium]
MLKGKLKVSYKALRSILFSAIIIVGILFGSLYVLLSLPFVQNFIGKTAEEELTSFLGGEVRIGDVSIFPFNEVVLSDVSLSTPQGEECISVGRLGAGINLWTLLVNRKIEITYAEIIELDAHINKPAPDSPLNIQFLIDAFSPKDKNKPPAKFDLKIHNIVIRRSRLSYDNLYVEKSTPMGRFDSNHVRIEKLNADVLIPRLSNEDMEFDVRRISLMLNPDLHLTELSFKAKLTEHHLDLANFYIQFPHSGFHLNDQHLSFSERGKILESLKNSSRKIEIKNGIILPADFGCFFEPLREFTTPWR